MEDASAARPAAQEVSWREVFRRAPVASLLATGLGTGLLPMAPGTWGSLLAVALGEGLLRAAGFPGLVALAAASTVVGVPAAGRVASIRGREDPPEVVVDEVAGQTIALALLHAALPVAAPPLARWGLVLLAFVLFRVLDIAKPGWIDRLQSLPGGWGVMADDLLAGAVAGILSAAAAFFLT
ncbi:MAG: phosphatidylglycerophosphatase A [Thermoanaerobaculia bacterium]